MNGERMSYDELAAYYEQRHREGRDFEGLVPVKAKVAKDFSSVFSVRFKAGELAAVERAAKARKTTIGAFIREVALSAAAADAATSSEGKVELAPSEQETLFQALRQVIATKPETKPSRRARRANTVAQKS